MNKEEIKSFDNIKAIFGDRYMADTSCASFTTAKIGGIADHIIIARSKDELIQCITFFCKENIPFRIIGNGSNVLISDKGIRGVLIINQAKDMIISKDSQPPSITIDAGALLSNAANQAAQQGLSGLEWAAYIPGTVGGAIYGNAGAHGCDISNMLEMVEILQPDNKIENWSSDQMQYSYRSSRLKRDRMKAVILSAQLNLSLSTVENVNKRMKEIIDHRRKIQPPGASMGSMFKNPPGDHAARLIEACGLKGKRIGGAEISPVHANFFINHDGTTAEDTKQLIEIVKNNVIEKFDVELELEIEFLGEWK